MATDWLDRKSTRLNSSHTEIYTLSLHDALPILRQHPLGIVARQFGPIGCLLAGEFLHFMEGDGNRLARSEEHTSELQSHRDLHSFPTRRSSDLAAASARHSRSPVRANRLPSRGRVPALHGG